MGMEGTTQALKEVTPRQLLGLPPLSLPRLPAAHSLESLLKMSSLYASLNIMSTLVMYSGPGRERNERQRHTFCLQCSDGQTRALGSSVPVHLLFIRSTRSSARTKSF
jgi:hypothetical protein